MHSSVACTKESQGFQDLGVKHNDSRLKDMWFMVNMQLVKDVLHYLSLKFNQNIKLWVI